MRFLPPLLFLVCSLSVFAQAQPATQPADDSEVARAKTELAKIQALVDAGALPRVQQQKAEDAVAAAEDSALIRKYIFQQDLTEDQANQLTAAAQRQFNRCEKAFDEAEKLVENGIAPQLSLSAYLQDMDFARKECDLAETRARLAREITDMALTEQAYEASAARFPGSGRGRAEHFPGNGVFNPQIFQRIETAFQGRFGRPLPVSADGETAVHRALGFDHRGRIDVAIHPDQPEGIWLRSYLIQHNVPFFAFRQAVSGQATGAHFHLGTASTRLSAAARRPAAAGAGDAGGQ
jgi:hypothetical protein